jgi:hypothetical protein
MQQRSIWEGDQELVKRSGKDESVWVEIHLCMEAMLGISLFHNNEKNSYKIQCVKYSSSQDKNELTDTISEKR